MIYVSYILSYVSILFNFYVIYKCYQSVTYEKAVFKFSQKAVMIICAIIPFLGNYYLISSLRMIFTLSSLFCVLKYIFNENSNFVIYKLFIIYITLLICDFFSTFTLLLLPFSSMNELANISLIRMVYTILVSVMLRLCFLNKRFKLLVNKIVNFLIDKINFSLVILCFSLFIVFVLLTYLNTFNVDVKLFVICLVLIIIFLSLGLMIFSQHFKNKSAKEEQKTLLTLLNDYEKLFENDCINRHEMLNNLVVLKSVHNKSSREYEDMLDEIIKDYQIKKSSFYSKLYNLPSGIKGVIYYKLANINNNEINLNLLIAPDVKEIFESFNSKLYYKICKILGIIIDNALEATLETKDKLLLIDIYLENNDMVFYMENSFINSVDINKISDKGVSSKGSGRGYGLFLVNKIIKDSTNLKFEQFIRNSNFVTILTVKNSSDN